MIRPLLLAALLLLRPGLAAAIDITSCDQVVPKGQVGEVLNDLDCSGGTFAAGVTLLNHATLRLNGHRINGPVTSGALVHATGKAAKIVGPGEVDTSDYGCIIAEEANLLVEGGDGIDVHHCYTAVSAQNLRIANVTVHDNEGIAIYGVVLKAKDVVAYASWGGLAGGIRAHVENLTATDNLVFGVNAELLTVKDSTFTGNSWGVDGKIVTIRGSQITDNTNYGARANVMRVVDSTITGNGFAPSMFSSGPYGDLLGGKISLRRSTCGTSLTGNGGTLGICSDD